MIIRSNKHANLKYSAYRQRVNMGTKSKQNEQLNKYRYVRCNQYCGPELIIKYWKHILFSDQTVGIKVVII